MFCHLSVNINKIALLRNSRGGKRPDLLKAAADAEVRGFAASKKANGETLDKLKGGGMAILPPSAALKADMKKVGDTMLKEWLEKAGPEGKQLIDAFLK